MNHFRDDEQLDTVIRTLLGKDLSEVVYINQNQTMVSRRRLQPEEITTVNAANGLMGVRLITYMTNLFELSPERMMRLGSLLVAMANGPEDVDEWIEMMRRL